MDHFTHLKQGSKPALIIFPHAGAHPSKYEKWARGKLENSFNVFIFNKPLVHSWDELIKIIKADLQKLQVDQMYLFGHSMGALLAFFSTKDIKNKEFHLFLSGMNPPSSEQMAHFNNFSSMEYEELTEHLIKNGGITPELQKHPDMLTEVIKYVQKDFKLLASIKTPSSDKKSPHSYKVLFPVEDKLCQLKRLSDWKKYFIQSGEIKAFPGDHFYLFDYEKEVQDYLLEVTHK